MSQTQLFNQSVMQAHFHKIFIEGFSFLSLNKYLICIFVLFLCYSTNESLLFCDIALDKVSSFEKARKIVIVKKNITETLSKIDTIGKISRDVCATYQHWLLS